MLQSSPSHFLLLAHLFIFFLFRISEKGLERDKFMSPEEAKDFGLIDRVLSHPPPTEQALPTDDTVGS